MRTRSATSSSRQATSPPSPSANRFFVGKKLNVEQTPGLRHAVCAEGLRRVLDQREPERRKLAERRRPPEEVHRHDRLRPRSDPRRDVLRVEVECHGVDVGEHGCRTDTRDRLGGRVERERRADDLVVAPDSERFEREHERVGSVRDADRMRDSEERGRFALERLDLGPEDEPAGLENRGEPLLELGDERRVLRLHVDEWNLLRHAGECSSGEAASSFVRRLKSPRRAGACAA